MRTIFCHVEEPSMEAMLLSLLPRVIAGRTEWKIINHGSKNRLLKDMPQRLTGYKGMAQTMDLGILVLTDRDNDDCQRLKGKLEQIASERGMPTKSNPGHDRLFLVVNRVVVEELEAWFFGDPAAVREAYPRMPDTLENNKKYRDPDAIPGGTWEALHREMKKAGYFKGHFPKLEVARNIAPKMDPENNRSASFKAFRNGLDALLALPSPLDAA